MDRITFTFGGPYDDDSGWAELIVEAGDKVAHGAYPFLVQEAEAFVDRLKHVRRSANDAPYLSGGYVKNMVGATTFENFILFDVEPTDAPGMFLVSAEAIDNFEPAERVTTKFSVTEQQLRKFQQACEAVMHNEAKEAVLAREEVATAGKTFAESAAVALAE